MKTSLYIMWFLGIPWFDNCGIHKDKDSTTHQENIHVPTEEDLHQAMEEAEQKAAEGAARFQDYMQRREQREQQSRGRLTSQLSNTNGESMVLHNVPTGDSIESSDDRFINTGYNEDLLNGINAENPALVATVSDTLIPNDNAGHDLIPDDTVVGNGVVGHGGGNHLVVGNGYHHDSDDNDDEEDTSDDADDDDDIVLPAQELPAKRKNKQVMSQT